MQASFTVKNVYNYTIQNTLKKRIFAKLFDCDFIFVK